MTRVIRVYNHKVKREQRVTAETDNGYLRIDGIEADQCASSLINYLEGRTQGASPVLTVCGVELEVL